jgi:ribose 5-phosphate isomerase A
MYPANMSSYARRRFTASAHWARPVSPLFRPQARHVVMRAVLSKQDELKKQTAWKAVEYVESGMVVGLGTGSTAAFAVDRIGDLMKKGKLKDIIAVPTSIRTKEQAESLGIPLATLDTQPRIDVAIDGADEVDPNLDVVKGRGGALLREKMVERASKLFVCIVDDSKLVDGLGGSKLAMPVEIVQFCHQYTKDRIAALPEVAGCEAKLRMDGDKPYVTDNSNYIVDLYFDEPIKDSHAAAEALERMDGVVEHGLFMNMVNVCIVAGAEGVEVKERK